MNCGARKARIAVAARGLQAPVRMNVKASANDASAVSPSWCVKSSPAAQSTGRPSKKSPSRFAFLIEKATG